MGAGAETAPGGEILSLLSFIDIISLSKLTGRLYPAADRGSGLREKQRSRRPIAARNPHASSDRSLSQKRGKTRTRDMGDA
jgi:hypothetical protein